MGNVQMKFAWLTTSRADFGICLPMIQKLKAHANVQLEIIATGSHLLTEHGNTITEIKSLGIPVHEVVIPLNGQDATSVALSYAGAGKVFSEFWSARHDYDLVFALGDRYEMAAALVASIPFCIPIAHLCGGDVTDGATDQIYRDMISMMSKFHFTTEERSAARVVQLKRPYSGQVIANVGSLAIEQMNEHKDIDAVSFMTRWGIDLKQPFCLVTLHPETMDLENNKRHVSEVKAFLLRAIQEGSEQWLITLPNADAESELWREMLMAISTQYPDRMKCHAHLGVQGYYTAMKNCKAMIGNTSSGIVESATFGAWVLNLGNRQGGRSRNPNVYDLSFDQNEIWEHWKGLSNERYKGVNLYGDGTASSRIMEILKDNLNALHEL